MSYAPTSFNAPIAGIFTEASFGHRFEYAVSDHSPFEGYDHVVFCGDEVRYARILKTRAYVVIDETDDSQPIIEKWVIRGHSEYPRAIESN